MKKYSIIVLTFLILQFAGAQEKMDYFLPADVTYDPAIPTPEQFFNQQVGEWHLTHDKIYYYITEIARLSDRAVLEEYARTYENRPLVNLVFSSPENMKQLGQLKEKHYLFSEPGRNITREGVPLVLYLGYGVHGNESSGPNSAVLTAYYLAAARGEKIDRLLQNCIILVDPSLNPDGMTRQSDWANQTQSAVPMPKSDSRQFSEGWPGGRGNHYWFDLNRDYLLLVHPESRGRVKRILEWKPNILNDHHEMGSSASFFFQPGVTTRINPLTPGKNQDLTGKIASYHSKYLDNIGSYYYTEEGFDDFYLGKGSSYPDINGGIGILFEQAGFRGRITNTPEGPKKLAFAIRNQFTVTLSTLDAAMNLRDELLDYQKTFYTDALDQAGKDPVKGYVFGNNGDKTTTNEFIKLLNQHQIKVYNLRENFQSEGFSFSTESGYCVPANQKQYLLIKTLFDRVKTFKDTTFYDVSTWTMPFAFNLPFAEVRSQKELQNICGNRETEAVKIKGTVIGGESRIGYVFRWNEYLSPNALNVAQQHGLLARVASENFDLLIGDKTESFLPGSIFIPAAGQKITSGNIFKIMTGIAESTGVDMYSATTGLTPSGIDLGSNNFIPLEKQEILMAAGPGVNGNDAGELWYLFDQRYKIPVCLINPEALGSAKLDDYTTLILPGGNYNLPDKGVAMKIRSWVQAGGVLIACESAAQWAAQNELSKTRFKSEPKADTSKLTIYANRNKEADKNQIAGSIFMAEMDITHPLCYGYATKNVAVMKTGTMVAESLNIPYSEPARYTAEPYVSGYVSEKNLNRIKKAPILSVQKSGSGKVISFYESVNFRGVWMGTNKMLMNAVFFGKTIR